MQTGDEPNIFISTMPAGRRHRAAALTVVAISSLLFALAVPFAKLPLGQVPGFVASYQSALAINNLITAALLLSQFAALRSWALLLASSGYLFAAAAALVHALTFPGLFAPTGLLQAGPQTTAWLHIIWHGVFLLLVLGYALTKAKGAKVSSSAKTAILGSIAAVGLAIFASTWLMTVHHELLPELLLDGYYTPTLGAAVLGILCLSVVTLVALRVNKPYAVLDVWLMVVLCALMFEIALSALVNAARFDLGFYAGRIYGLCAASFVLIVLLLDHVALQAKTARLLVMVRRQAGDRERLFSAVVESSNDAIITKTLDGTITAWNRAAERLFGYSSAEAVGKHIRLIVPLQLRDEMYDILERIGRGEAVASLETRRLRKDGHEIDVMLSISPLRSVTGEIIGASKIACDITETKRTQRALSREIEERECIFQTSQDLILVTDTAGNFVQVSPSSLSILGYHPKEMIGYSAVDFIHPDDLDRAREEMRAARRGQQMCNFESRYRHKDGHEVVLNWMGTWSQSVRRHFFIGRDLTEKRAAEAQFRQSQKMDAVGQLTGGIAHDFNNILTVITGTIGILADAVVDRPELVSIAKLIDDAAERGAQLTKHLLAFARKQPLRPREIDVNALVLQTAKLLHPTLGQQIQISTRLAADVWPAMVDPNQLTTAILNLSLNARDAMPNGGKLTLETRNVFLDDGYASMHSEVAAGDYVMIAVSDTGLGIAAAHLEKVFDPFFTTKEVGKGTGLGLSMVFGFVKQSGGHVKIYSEEGHGTGVKLYLPRSAGLELGTQAPLAANIEGGRGETILVVEDDALVRKYVITQIESLGYTTLEAANATEALAIIEKDGPIDLLFTDVIMPGPMNGRQLADAAAKRRPALKTLFTSGYTQNALLHHGKLDAGVMLLAKPYRKPELARMIRVALAAGGDRQGLDARESDETPSIAP